jgi:Flp pilus assembly protein TadD
MTLRIGSVMRTKIGGLKVAGSVLLAAVLPAGTAHGQERAPRSGWDDARPVQAKPVTPKIAPDLQALYDRSASAVAVKDFNSIVEGCRTLAGDTTRPTEEREYARTLLSWAANRRGELRSDMAGQMVRDKQMDEAEKLDRAAAMDFALAIEFDPRRWRAHHNLGISQAMSDDLEQAIQSFTTTMELNPKFVEAWHNRGELLARNKDFAGAIADFSKALELAPEDALLFGARGRAKSSSGDLEGALSDFRSAMDFDPQSGEAATEYADACQSLGRWKDAAEAYQKAMQQAPANPRTLQNAAWLMATCPEEFYRNPETALKTAERAIEVKDAPPGAHLLHVLGVAQAANGDFASAVSTLNEALQTTSNPSLRAEIAQHRALFQRQRVYVQPAVEAK